MHISIRYFLFIEKQGKGIFEHLLKDVFALPALKCYHIRGFLKLVKSYTEPEQLTPEILHMFVEKVVVHIPEKLEQHRVQQVDIFYNFVGQIDMSLETAKICRRTKDQMAEYRSALAQQI